MPLTNVEFVTRMMEFSPAGPMTQLVVVHAIEGYVRQVANIPLKEWLTQCQKPIDENRVWSMISPGAWHAACSSMTRDFDARGAS